MTCRPDYTTATPSFLSSDNASASDYAPGQSCSKCTEFHIVQRKQIACWKAMKLVVYSSLDGKSEWDSDCRTRPLTLFRLKWVQTTSIAEMLDKIGQQLPDKPDRTPCWSGNEQHPLVLVSGPILHTQRLGKGDKFNPMGWLPEPVQLSRGSCCATILWSETCCSIAETSACSGQHQTWQQGPCGQLPRG